MIGAWSKRVNMPELNPLTAALPPEMAIAELAEWLDYSPPCPEGLTAAGVLPWLQSAMVATPMTVQIAASALELMRQAADFQDLRNVANRSRALNVKIILTTPRMMRPNSSGMTVCGITGVGKSHIFTRLLERIPQVVVHGPNSDCEMYELRQLVHLTIFLSGDGSPKAFFYSAIQQIDLALGTDYSSEMKDGQSVAKMLAFFMHKLVLHRVLFLVIEEAQQRNVDLSKHKGTFESLLLGLLNFGIPTAVVGNPAGVKPLLRWSQIGRRLRAGGEFRLEPALSWQEGLWRMDYVPAIWSMNSLPMPDEDWCPPEALAETLWNLTGGFPDHLVNLRALCIKGAMERGSPRVEQIDIEGALSSALYRGCMPLVNAFVNRDASLLDEQFEDVDVEHYRKLWAEAPPLRGASELHAENGSSVKVGGGDDQGEPMAPQPDATTRSKNSVKNQSRKRAKRTNGPSAHSGSGGGAPNADDVRSAEWLAKQPKLVDR